MCQNRSPNYTDSSFVKVNLKIYSIFGLLGRWQGDEQQNKSILEYNNVRERSKWVPRPSKYLKRELKPTGRTKRDLNTEEGRGNGHFVSEPCVAVWKGHTNLLDDYWRPQRPPWRNVSVETGRGTQQAAVASELFGLQCPPGKGD